MPGEIAEMMLDGTMCQGCGEFMHGGGDGPGFPGYCAGCRREDNRAPRFRKQPKNLAHHKVHVGPHQCDLCDRGYASEHSLAQHRHDSHGRVQAL